MDNLTSVDRRANGETALIRAAREAAIEPPGSTHSGPLSVARLEVSEQSRLLDEMVVQIAKAPLGENRRGALAGLSLILDQGH